MATVNLINVSKQVGQTSILDDVSLNVKYGEFIVVVGPSGCGKSSLLRLIAGLDDLSGGKILIDDECINDIPPAKRDMAMVFQSYALYPHMSVYDNMAYGLKMRRIAKDEIKQRVADAAKLLHLTPYLDRKPQALSGGQRQRVAMGRAIVRQPAVFLFDEPLSNLDAKLRSEMRHEIKRMHQKFKTTSLYVTHDQTEAMTMAERVMVLNQGKIEQIGTPQELYQNPGSEFVAGFTGHYPINFISGTYYKNIHSVHTPLGTFALPTCDRVIEDNSSIMMGVRPEHVTLGSPEGAQGIQLKVEFVDDMGADKLIQAKSTKNGSRFNLRVPADYELSDYIEVVLPQAKLHFFDQESGKRIGERA